MRCALLAFLVAAIPPLVACSDSATTGSTAAGDAGADSGGACGPGRHGSSCDDGDPCTTGDQCGASGCAGTPKVCDDGLDCTADGCGTGGACSHAPKPAWCHVTGTGCVADGAAKSGDPCRVCNTAKSAVEFSLAPTACDDGNACTKGDACDPAGACTGTVAVCDDKNPCTTDSCDAKAGCKTAVTPGPCADGDPCTTGDLCADGTCKAGTGKLGCDDNNGCTLDSCKPGMGCVHALTKQACDDGEPCTSPDACTGGVCVGVKTFQCPKCDLLFGPTAGKLTQFLIGNSGKAGQGIDVDGDAKTCAPEGNCADGVDNSAAVLSGFLNTPLINGVSEGTLTFVAEFAGYVGEGVPFTLNLYYAEMAQESEQAGCKKNADVCKWLVGQSGLTAQCKPKFSFSDATVKNGKLNAGTKDTVFAMDADLLGAKNATLYVKGARIQGAVEFAADKKSIVGVQGVLGGAVPQAAVIDMINAVDASLFGGLGLSKQEILELVAQILVLDIDVDGDGGKESASIGIRFSAVGAALVGTVK
ncbi:MAG: hypothetical protein FJ100_17655 [Deltaproteobacteria bacterium]|nr:hypothetical protein [Deltaproteobacteria bacterium]